MVDKSATIERPMEQQPRQGISPDMLASIQKRNQAFGEKMLKSRRDQVEAYQEDTPKFAETNEIGIFAGIFTKRIAGDQVLVRPYYQTESGIHFCEVRGPQGEKVIGPSGEPITVQINLETLNHSDTARLYTAEGYIRGKPLPRPQKPQK